MRRIFNDYEGYENQPEYSVSDNGVIVTLYKMSVIMPAKKKLREHLHKIEKIIF